MKKENKPMPRALSQELGEKLSYWLSTFSDHMQANPNFKEEIFELIRRPMDFQFDEDDKKIIQEVLSRLLSLSFLLERHADEVDSFYEDYNI